MLNRSKGAAVHGPRVQADRKHFAASTQALLKAQQGLTIVEGHAESLILRGDAVEGVRLTGGTELRAKSVILATGTFLGGRLFCGSRTWEGGRVGDRSATVLAEQLRELKLPISRLKTGTPPRLDGRRIDWSRLQMQPTDQDQWTMSPFGTRMLPQVACGITRTNDQTHDIIRAGLERSPLFTGAIGGQGPRYCPSIEDKVVRFGDRDGHQVFLEPEGLGTTLIYPNGISTSLPEDVQLQLVRSIAGLGNVDIVQAGYAVEYDHLDPRALDDRLGIRAINGLFASGQINGTTGYEEAAAQGLVAGLNAVAHALDRDAVRFERTTSYIGVMIDDLTLQGVSEPYRMLTGRAELRLALRADNAVTRLGEQAISTGALSSERADATRRRLDQHAEVHAAMEQALPRDLREGSAATLAQIARQRELTPREAKGLLGSVADDVKQDVFAEVVDDCRYAPYIARQREEIGRVERDGGIKLSHIISYSDVGGLSNEMVEKLEATRPVTLEQAARIRGITPAALSAILVTVRRKAA
jgi:tRNA uridine 5-carboxymethylaminomethyl modification enzyme